MPENDCRLGVSSNCSFFSCDDREDGLFGSDLERDDATDDGVFVTNFERFERRVSGGLYRLIPVGRPLRDVIV